MHSRRARWRCLLIIRYTSCGPSWCSDWHVGGKESDALALLSSAAVLQALIKCFMVTAGKAGGFLAYDWQTGMATEALSMRR